MHSWSLQNTPQSNFAAMFSANCTYIVWPYVLPQSFTCCYLCFQGCWHGKNVDGWVPDDKCVPIRNPQAILCLISYKSTSSLVPGVSGSCTTCALPHHSSMPHRKDQKKRARQAKELFYKTDVEPIHLYGAFQKYPTFLLLPISQRQNPQIKKVLHCIADRQER